MIVDTGPNASTSWTALGRPRIVGAEQDRVHEGAAVGADRGFEIARDDARARGDELGDLAADVVALGAGDQGAHRAPCRAGRRPSAPRASARSATSTASRCSAGTMARRMAVHFCPALTVISLTTSLTNRSNSGVPGAASGPRIEALRLSCSATNLTHFAQHDRVRLELERGRGRAGEADHVLPGRDGRTDRRPRRRSAAARRRAAGRCRS